MVRKIITIDAEKCNGCGLCAEACHEGAIGMVNGKATLLKDDYCDGLGDCLPVCPTGAITFETREAAAYDEAAVKARMAQKDKQTHAHVGCPGAKAYSLSRTENTKATPESVSPTETASRLNSWPVQIKLVPINAPYFENAHVLVSADCAAYACGHFHQSFMRNKITLIGCPKLDDADYSEKLTTIFKQNAIKSVTVVRMSVPCCGGLENAVKTALINSGKMIPWRVVTLSTDGTVLAD